MENLNPVHIFIGSLERGGTQRNCVNISNMLSTHGHKVSITTVRLTSKDGYQSELNENIKFSSLNKNSTLVSALSIFKIIKKIDKQTNIFIMNYELIPFVIFTLKILKMPNRILVRNMNYFSKEIESKKNISGKFFLRNLLMIAIPKCNVVIHQCKEMKDDFDSYFSSFNNKSIVINNVLDASNDYIMPIDDKKKYMLCVGRLAPQKNFKLAIDILNAYINKYGDIKLLIIGDGELRHELESYAKELNLENHIKFLGMQNSITSYYKGAYVTILTSDYEGFPNVLIESIHSGTPVVAHNCRSGPSELIINGKNGYLVNYQKITEFIDAIKRIEEIDRSNIKQTVTQYLPNHVYFKYSSIL